MAGLDLGKKLTRFLKKTADMFKTLDYIQGK